MAMVFRKGGDWMVGGKKHEGKTLAQVADEDPSYLNWMWNDVGILAGMSEDAQRALQDVMEEKGVPFDPPKRKRKPRRS